MEDRITYDEDVMYDGLEVEVHKASELLLLTLLIYTVWAKCMFGGDWGVQRQKQFLCDLPGMFRSLLLIVHSILFTAAMAHDISLQHKPFVPKSSASTWREWATLCYFTMAKLLADSKREVHKQLIFN